MWWKTQVGLGRRDVAEATVTLHYLSLLEARELFISSVIWRTAPDNRFYRHLNPLIALLDERRE